MPILNKKIQYRTSYKMKKNFESEGFIVDKDRYINIDIIDLVRILPSSTLKVEYKCDKCHNIFKSKICNINKNTGIDKLDKTYCRKCGQVNTLIQNHGVACPFSSEKIRNKARTTMKERYGTEYAMQNDNIKEKAKQTVREHYGEQYTSSAQVPEVREKMLKSFQEKHGYEYQNPMQSAEVQQKAKNTMKERYGAEHALQIPEFKDKAVATLQKHYGKQYINSLQVPGIREKAINTWKEKYGCTNPRQVPEVLEKMQKTLQQNYGKQYNYPLQIPKIYDKMINTIKQKYGNQYINSMQIPSVQEKSRQTLQKHYGSQYNYPMQIPEVYEKHIMSLCNNQKVATSSQQIYLHKLFGGKLNLPIKIYAADIALLDDHIVIEYNGGGHDLSVKLGRYSQQEFKQREIVRNYTLVQSGWKIITFIAPTDSLLPDQQLLILFNKAKQYLLTTNHTWVNIYLEENKYECHEFIMPITEIISTY